jgi:hypothetical protein
VLVRVPQLLLVRAIVLALVLVLGGSISTSASTRTRTSASASASVGASAGANASTSASARSSHLNSSRRCGVFHAQALEEDLCWWSAKRTAFGRRDHRLSVPFYSMPRHDQVGPFLIRIETTSDYRCSTTSMLLAYW